MTVLVQVIDRLGSRAGLEFVCLSCNAETRWHVEAITHIPVDLDIGIVNPEILDIFLRRCDVLALSRNHLCPATKKCGWLAFGIKHWEGNNAEVIAQRLSNTRHGPQPAPLHRA